MAPHDATAYGDLEPLEDTWADPVGVPRWFSRVDHKSVGRRYLGDPSPHGGTTASPPAMTTVVGPIPGSSMPVSPSGNPYANDRPAIVGQKIAMAREVYESILAQLRQGQDEVGLFSFDRTSGNDATQLFGSIAQGPVHGMPSSQTNAVGC